jgi:hypothetical protein
MAILSRIAGAFVGMALCASMSGAAFAYSGTLGNVLDRPITYYVGIPDAQGFVDWQPQTLASCATKDWSWTQGGEPNLHMIYPLWLDERRGEDGNIIMERRPVPMSPQGGLAVFFPMGEQIWIDVSGGATMEACQPGEDSIQESALPNEGSGEGTGELSTGCAGGCKWALIFVGENLERGDNLWALPRIVAEQLYLEGLGYHVDARVGTEDAILDALVKGVNGEIHALSYFGHGVGPTMEYLDASGWEARVRQRLMEQYRAEGLSAEAVQARLAQFQGIGLEFVRNHSCDSLSDNSLADFLVRPGGVYHGSTGSYVPCPSWSALNDDTQFILGVYERPQTEGPTN